MSGLSGYGLSAGLNSGPEISGSGLGSPPALLDYPIEAAALGNSYVANSINIGSTTWLDSRGWMNWGNAMMGAPMRLRPLAFQGTPGDTTTQILARVNSITSLNPKPKLCFIDGGVNDFGAAVSLATVYANYKSIIAALNAAGIIAVIGPCFATDAASAQYIADAQLLNGMLQKLARPSQVIWCDWSNMIQGSGLTVANTLYDGIHPGSVGARGMGAAVASAISLLLLREYPLATSASPGLLTNPLLTGTTGTLGSGFTGVAPTSWTFYRNATPSAGTLTSAKVARSDGHGEWTELALAGIVSAGKFQAGLLSPAASYTTLGLATDEVYEVAAEIEVDAGAVNLDGPTMQVVDSDGTTQLIHQFGYLGLSGAAWGGGSWSGTQRFVIKSPTFTIRAQAGTTSLRVRILFNGDGTGVGGITATMRAGRVTMKRV